MKLYYSPHACSLAVQIVLNELSLNYELEKVDTATHTTATGTDFLTINSKGYVPTLAIRSDFILTEGPVICQWLADQHGQGALLPATHDEQRYRVLEWQNFITSELHKGFTPLFKFQSVIDTASLDILRQSLFKKYEWLNQQLANKQFLVNEQFSIADAYLFTVTRWAGFVNLDLSGLDHIQRYQAALEQRPSIQAALSKQV